MNIYIKSIKGYSFTGTISDDQLTDDQLKALGLIKDPNYVNEVELIGEFSVEWDYDIPMPRIDSKVLLLGAYNGKTYKKPIQVQSSQLDSKLLYSKTEYVQAKEQLTLELELDESTLETLENELVDSGDSLEWSSDRLSSMADAAYDAYKDSLH